MRMDTQAKKEIREIAHKLSNGAIKVEYPGLADNGYVRVTFKAAGMKPRQMLFDRVSRKRTDLPDTLAAAREILGDMQKAIERRTGTFGAILREAITAKETLVEPPEPEVLSPPEKEEEPIAMSTDLPAKDLKIPAPVPLAKEPGTRSHLSNREIMRATKVLTIIGDADEDAGTYTYLDGYCDEMLRALVNPEVKIETYIKWRKEGFGKVPSEIRPKKLTKNQQIERLTQQVKLLEAENAQLKAKLPKPTLGLAKLNGVKPHDEVRPRP